MATNNIGLIFNKTYYDKLGAYYNKKEDFFNDLSRKNKQIFNTGFYADRDYRGIPDTIAPQKFCMSTVYPGLLVGIGYVHGTGLEGADDDIKIGFSFDYVTGLPYIPASSVKGLLRSAFSHCELIKDILGKDITEPNIKTLENDIFGYEDEKTEGKDVFFDAIIRYSNREDKRILGDDYITPHNGKEGKNSNPVPIYLIRLLPGVIIEFNFCLRETVLDGITVNAKEKKRLFIEILKLLGIGAKTNVGYGILTEYDESRLPKSDPVKEPPHANKLDQAQQQTNSVWKTKTESDNSTGLVGKNFTVIVEKLEGDFCIGVLPNDEKVRVSLVTKKNGKKQIKKAKEGKSLSVQITGICKDRPGIKWLAE